MTNLIIVAALALSNFMIFLGLVLILVRGRRRHQDSSYKITPVAQELDPTEIIPKFAKTKSEATVVMDNRPLVSGRHSEPEVTGAGGRAQDKAKVPQEASVR